MMNLVRTLIVAENLPYPTLKGGDLRTWQNVNALKSIGPVGVFGLYSDDARSGVSPPPDVALWRVSTDPALAHTGESIGNLAARAWLLSPSGHPADLYYSTIAADEIREIVFQFMPSIVVIERLWLHRYIESIKGGDRRIVLDCHNVEANVYRQIGDSIDTHDLKGRLMRETLPSRTEMIERQAVHAVDQIWACSEGDGRMLRQLYRPAAPIHVVPNAISIENYEAARKLKSQPIEEMSRPVRSLVFPAMFAYPPNSRAARFLIQEVLPLLAGHNKRFQLLLVGSMPSPLMLEAAREDSRIGVTGAVPDMRPYLAAASAVVVPLFEGGGTRFKIIEAFAALVPVISTAKGAEGLAVKDGTHLLIAETAAEFVAAVKRLWSDEQLAQRIASNALALVKRHYSWRMARRRINRAVQELAPTVTQSS